MTTYAIDINNPKVISAMKALGILPKELISLSFSDFYEKGISEEIQKLRHEHYQKILNESINAIKTKFKQNRGWSFDKFPNEKPKSPLNLEKSIDLHKLKERHKEIILTKIDDIDKEVKGKVNVDKRIDKANHLRQKLREENYLKKAKLRQFVYIQKNNLDQLKKKEELVQEENFRNYSPQTLKYSDSPSELHVHGRQSLSRMSRIKPDDITDEEIEIRLGSIHKKIERSKSIHAHQASLRKEKLFRKHSDQSLKRLNVSDYDNIETVIKLVSRQKNATERRAQSAMRQRESIELSKKKYAERYNQAVEKQKEKQKAIVENEDRLDKKIKETQKMIDYKKRAVRKSIEFKAEISKLKLKDTLTNAERHRRALVIYN